MRIVQRWKNRDTRLYLMISFRSTLRLLLLSESWRFSLSFQVATTLSPIFLILMRILSLILPFLIELTNSWDLWSSISLNSLKDFLTTSLKRTFPPFPIIRGIRSSVMSILKLWVVILIRVLFYLIVLCFLVCLFIRLSITKKKNKKFQIILQFFANILHN